MHFLVEQSFNDHHMTFVWNVVVDEKTGCYRIEATNSRHQVVSSGLFKTVTEIFDFFSKTPGLVSIIYTT